ncbi:conserved hypothetical protein [Alteromonas macleodii]
MIRQFKTLKNGHYHFFSVKDFPPSAEILANYDVFFVVASVVIAISASLFSFVLSAKMSQTELQNERALLQMSGCLKIKSKTYRRTNA